MSQLRKNRSEKIKTYKELDGKSFINKKEQTYLLNSIQKPIAALNISKGKGNGPDLTMILRQNSLCFSMPLRVLP